MKQTSHKTAYSLNQVHQVGKTKFG